MSIIIISILTILGWTSLFKQTFTTKEGFKYVYQPISKILYTLDFKPLSCAYCLSFWIGLVFTIAFMDLSYMVIFFILCKTRLMDYRQLKWGALKSYATKLGINTKGMTKQVLLEWLDAMPDVAHGIEELTPFTGIKQEHPLFEEIKDYLPYLKAYKKLNAISRDPKINKAIAALFLKYIEEDKNIRLNLGCGICKQRYYQRMIAGYNRLVEEHGGERI